MMSVIGNQLMTPELSSAVIPTYAMRGDEANCGCAFVVKAIDGTHWLIAPAHMPTWPAIGGPNLDFDNWSQNLFSVDLKFGRVGNVGIGLFDAPGQPCCRLIQSEFGERASGHDPSSGETIEDILAVRFPLEMHQRAGAFLGVRVIDLSSPAPPIQRPGNIVAFGFPVPEPDEVERGKKWPDPEPTAASGKLYDLQFSRYLAEMTCNSGLCGAPVFTAEGVFVGMINGSDHDTHTSTRIVPDFVIWALVNDRPIDGIRAPAGYENAPSSRSGGPRRFQPLGRIIGDGRPLSPAFTSQQPTRGVALS